MSSASSWSSRSESLDRMPPISATFSGDVPSATSVASEMTGSKIVAAFRPSIGPAEVQSSATLTLESDLYMEASQSRTKVTGDLMAPPLSEGFLAAM